MGGAQSTPVLQRHLQQWEGALQQLDQLCANGRRMMEQDRIYGNSADASKVGERDDDVSERGAPPRRPSSLVSFNNTNNGTSGGQGHVSTENMNNINNNGNNGGGVSNGSLFAHRQRSLQASPENRQVEVKPAGFTFSPGVAGSTGGNGVAGALVSSAINNDGAARSVGSTSAPPVRHTRQQVLELKKHRTNLFKSYEFTRPQLPVDAMENSHFGAVAVALSYLLGGDKTCTDRRKKVTMEDIFFAAQVPLHMLHTGPPHLPVMADIIREFLDVDNRFKDEFSVEALHLDISPAVGQVDLGPNDVGDRQTRMQLPEFRRVITQECEEETGVVRVVNYDPYVLEQEMLVDAYEDEDELNSPLAASVLGNPRLQHRQYNRTNDGAYAVIVDVRNAVQLMVTIAQGIVTDSVYVRLVEVPAASLFKAMMSAEEGHRARGFIRIFRRDTVAGVTCDEIPQFWTPELCSGKVLGTTQYGTHISVVSYHISPHIVGVAWAMHLLGGVRPGTHGYGNGLPVSDIIRVMRFPPEVFLDGTLPLEQVYEYAKEYIARTSRPYQLRLYPVLTKISREDAVPTISVFDLESILMDVKAANDDPEVPEHVLLIMYNANVAHNILYVANNQQWCVLAGYDQETQTALLIDAHPKMFSRTWSCPLDRLHKAITGNGYMVFSRNASVAGGAVSRAGGLSNPGTARSANSSVKYNTNATNSGGSLHSADMGSELHCVGAPQALAPTVQARLQLVERQNDMSLHTGLPTIIRSFAFPPLPVMPTMIAMACCKVGFNTTFDDVIGRLPYEISTLIIRNFTLESLHVCLSTYLVCREQASAIQVTVHHCESDMEGNQRLPLEAFRTLVESALDAEHALLVLFDNSKLQVHGACNPFGSLGLVVSYDATTESVGVSDCNPNSYLRVWPVPLSALYGAIMESDSSHKVRARGCLMLVRASYTRHVFADSCTRHFRLDILPVHSLFHVSPSPHFQGMSLAFAQLGHFYSPEEIFYEAYLTTMDDQRRRGSQAFAWRDVDVSLSVIDKKIDAAFMALVCNKFLESRNAHTMSSLARRSSGGGGVGNATGEGSSTGASSLTTDIYVELIEDVDLEDELDKLLKDATQSEDTVLLLNYDTQRAHHIAGLGRSVALVRSYDAQERLVELWDAEFTVFGLSFLVTVEQLVEMGDLENEGRSPYGFVRFKRDPNGLRARKKLHLMKAPQTAEEEAEQEACLSLPAARRPHPLFDGAQV